MALSMYENLLKNKQEDNIIKKIGVLYYRIGNFKKSKGIFQNAIKY